MNAPVLTKEQVAAWGVEAASDRLGAFDWNGRFVALADSHEALRAECEAVRADRDSPWTTVNRVKAERDAALAEVARMRPVVEAAEELLEVAALRGDNELPHPCNDPKLWTARMQDAWIEAQRTMDDYRAKEPDHA